MAHTILCKITTRNCNWYFTLNITVFVCCSAHGIHVDRRTLNAHITLSTGKNRKHRTLKTRQNALWAIFTPWMPNGTTDAKKTAGRAGSVRILGIAEVLGMRFSYRRIESTKKTRSSQKTKKSSKNKKSLWHPSLADRWLGKPPCGVFHHPRRCRRNLTGNSH